jgi:hypothetical protein
MYAACKEWFEQDVEDCDIAAESNVATFKSARSVTTVNKQYSGTSIYDRLDIRTTWVTTKNFSFDLRSKSWITTRMPVKATWVTTRMAFVSFSLSLDTRVCGRNSGQIIALYN